MFERGTHGTRSCAALCALLIGSCGSAAYSSYASLEVTMACGGFAADAPSALPGSVNVAEHMLAYGETCERVQRGLADAAYEKSLYGSAVELTYAAIAQTHGAAAAYAGAFNEQPAQGNELSEAEFNRLNAYCDANANDSNCVEFFQLAEQALAPNTGR